MNNNDENEYKNEKIGYIIIIALIILILIIDIAIVVASNKRDKELDEVTNTFIDSTNYVEENNDEDNDINVDENDT